MVDRWMAGADCRAAGSGTRIYPYSMYWLLGNPFSLDGYLAQSGYSGEALELSTKQCALPSLRSTWGDRVQWGEGGGNGRSEGNGNWDW